MGVLITSMYPFSYHLFFIFKKERLTGRSHFKNVLFRMVKKKQLLYIIWLFPHHILFWALYLKKYVLHHICLFQQSQEIPYRKLRGQKNTPDERIHCGSESRGKRNKLHASWESWCLSKPVQFLLCIYPQFASGWERSSNVENLGWKSYQWEQVRMKQPQVHNQGGVVLLAHVCVNAVLGGWIQDATFLLSLWSRVTYSRGPLKTETHRLPLQRQCTPWASGDPDKTQS